MAVFPGNRSRRTDLTAKQIIKRQDSVHFFLPTHDATLSALLLPLYFSPLSVFLYPSPAGAPRSSSTFSLLFLPQCRARPRLRGPLQTPRTLGVVRVATVAESAKQPPRKKHKSRRARQWVIVTVIFHGRRTQSFCRNKIVVLVLGFEIPTMCPPVQLSSTHQ